MTTKTTSNTYCIFSAQYLPHMGGVERYTSYLALGLAKAGERVLIVTTNPGGLPTYEGTDGISVLRLPSIPLMGGRFPVPKPGKKLFRLMKKLNLISPNMVMVNTRFYFHSLYGVLYGHHKKARTFVLDHGSSHLSLHNPVLDWLGGLFEHGLTAVEKCFCKEFYGVSNASVHWLEHFHIQARNTLPNAVDLPAILERLEHPGVDFREKYGIPSSATVFVYTGRLLIEKGLPALASAFGRLCQERTDVYLLLAGDGPLEEELRKSANSRMILTGRLAPEEITDLLGVSDIFCLPSVSEGFSTSILEAAACKNYIMVTESACPHELMEDDSYGCILTDAKEETIYQGMVKALASREAREAAAAKTYENLQKHFTWERTVEKLMQLMQ